MRISWLLVSAITVAGCAHRTRTITLEPVEFRAGGEMVEARQLFDEASRAYTEGRYADALALYDRITRDFTSSTHVRPSLYNGGLAAEKLADPAAAARRYRQLVEAFRDSADALDALYRLGALAEEGSRHVEAVAIFDEILARRDLSSSDRVEALARKGAAQAKVPSHSDAEPTLRAALSLARDAANKERLDTEFYVGMAAYHLAEVAHAQFRALTLRPGDKELAADVEAKAQLLVLAQGRYLDTVRTKQVDWSTAAGYQLGLVYREFYDALVAAPLPPTLDEEGRGIYLEELKKKVRPLLTRALRIHESNLLMAERAGLRNEWVTRSTQQMDQLRALLEPGPAPTTPPPPISPPPATPKTLDDRHHRR